MAGAAGERRATALVACRADKPRRQTTQRGSWGWPGFLPLADLLHLHSSVQRANEAEAAALRALAAAQAFTKKDCLPCRVAEGLFIGGAGAARNLKALRKRGITAIVNAAPSVPCHFKDCPEDEFEYLVLPLFDDPDAGGCCVLRA